MKYLKSYEDHTRLFHDLMNRKAKVITYGMTDYNLTLYEHAKDVFNADTVAANFDSNKNKWGQTLSTGVVTMPLDVLSEMAGKVDGIVVVSGAICQIGTFLETLGLPFYFYQMMDGALPLRVEKQALYDKEQIEINSDKVCKAGSLMADLHSKNVFDSIITARTTGILRERFVLQNEVLTHDQYFPEWIPSFLPFNNEIFIDGGAYDGDTIRALKKLGKENGIYKHIYAFEPDPFCYAKLSKYASDDSNITCIKKGLHFKDTTFGLKIGDMSSRLTKAIDNDVSGAAGIINVEVCSIDNTIKDKVTFIKLDIEGSELAALKGAKKTIRANKPKLAICIYHKIHDFWEIPLYIKEIAPDYKFYAGHHSLSYDCRETVLYASA